MQDQHNYFLQHQIVTAAKTVTDENTSNNNINIEIYEKKRKKEIPIPRAIVRSYYHKFSRIDCSSDHKLGSNTSVQRAIKDYYLKTMLFLEWEITKGTIWMKIAKISRKMQIKTITPLHHVWNLFYSFLWSNRYWWPSCCSKRRNYRWKGEYLHTWNRSGNIILTSRQLGIK